MFVHGTDLLSIDYYLSLNRTKDCSKIVRLSLFCKGDQNRASRRFLSYNYTLEYITTYLPGDFSENRIRLLKG